MAKRIQDTTVTSKDRLLGSIVVFVVALAARLIYVNAAAGTPTFGFLTFDLLQFHNLAVSIFQDSQLGHEAVFKAPLYSLVLSQIYSMVSNPIFQSFVIQCILGSISAILIYLISVRFYTQRISITAGLIAALYGTLIFFDAELLPVSFTVFLILLATYLLMKYEEGHRVFLAVAAGITLALSGAATPETLVLVPVAGFWIYRDGAGKKKFRLSHTLAMLIAAVVVTVPFAIRNNTLGGEKVPYLTDIGVRMAIANQEGATGRDFILPNGVRELGQSYSNALEATQRTKVSEFSASEMGGIWLGQAVGYIFSHPLDWLGLELRKLACLISGYEISTDRPIYYFASQNMPLQVLLFDKFLSIPFGLILPFAFLAFLAVRHNNRKQLLLVWSATGLVLVSLLLAPFAFQRILFVPFIIIWSAAGFWGLVGLYQKQEFRRFYTWLSILVAAVVIVNGVAKIPGLIPTVDSEFEGRMFAANAHLTANRLEEAKTNYDAALRIDPRSPRPYSSLASIFAQQGNDSLAIVYYNRAVAVDPSDDRPLKNIVNLMKRKQKLAELNNVLVRVIKEFPKANWAYNEYASLHVRLSEFTQAADIYEKSFAADSTNIEAIFLKAEVYLMADMRQEAEEEFQRYLQYAPNSVAARANLGQVYARQRRIEEALREFGFVREQEPGNPATYFNLASVYYQTNDLMRAASYLDTADAIDHNFPGLEEMRQMIDSARVNR
ncbi:MAG: tetratricopeptide repeat protein [bacterium]|nr:tetratricopeptide repeat protein [bacterium]